MKVINLDKFKTEQRVMLEDAEYTIRAMTVEQWLNEMESAEAEEVSEKERFAKSLERISSMSDIPMEVLKRQQFGVLTALLQIAQGIIPAEPGAEAESEGK